MLVRKSRCMSGIPLQTSSPGKELGSLRVLPCGVPRIVETLRQSIPTMSFEVSSSCQIFSFRGKSLAKNHISAHVGPKKSCENFREEEDCDLLTSRSQENRRLDLKWTGPSQFPARPSSPDG